MIARLADFSMDSLGDPSIYNIFFLIEFVKPDQQILIWATGQDMAHFTS